MIKVPFVDLRAINGEVEEELRSVFERVLQASSFILGPEVENFEAEFATYTGTEHCVAVCNGTAALHLALLALGVSAGDEVITASHTFMSSAEAVTAVGARPVFVDIDPVSYNMDPSLLEAAVTSKTRAIMPVHLYGQTADLDPIFAIAEKHGIPVLEDACQAHGARYKERRAGSLGRAGCFSFFPGKNLGALGEGGAIVTNDAGLARHVRMLRAHGSPRKYMHDFPGFNMRMEGLQGGFLSVKLKHLDRWNDERRAAASQYHEALSDSGFTLPVEMAYGHHVYHLYVVQSENRDGLRERLAAEGIETGIHYPTPLHMQKAYRDLGYREGDFPVTESVASRILSLPIYPGIPAEAVGRVSAALMDFARAAV